MPAMTLATPQATESLLETMGLGGCSFDVFWGVNRNWESRISLSTWSYMFCHLGLNFVLCLLVG